MFKHLFYSIAISIITGNPINTIAQNNIRQETSLLMFEKSMQELNYTQAYFHIKYLERYLQDIAIIKFYKLQCLIYLADFTQKNDPFVEEVLEAIAVLEDANEKGKIDDLIDMELVRSIQLNFLKTGDLYTTWMNDPEFKKGVQFYEKKSYEKALINFNYATSKNNAFAYYYLGMMYDNGYGVPQDRSTANAYYETAAELNFGEAQFAYAKNMLMDGEEALEINDLTTEEKEIFKTHLLNAYKNNVPAAANLLGEYYAHFPKNDKDAQYNAYDWYVKAASKGDINAMIKLAELHCSGIGTVRSHNEASYWIDKVAERQVVSDSKIVELRDCIKDL